MISFRFFLRTRDYTRNNTVSIFSGSSKLENSKLKNHMKAHHTEEKPNELANEPTTCTYKMQKIKKCFIEQ